MSRNEARAQWIGKQARVWLAAGLTLGGLYLSSRYHYLLFHSLAELFSVVIGCGTFMIAWHSRQFLQNGYVLLLGIACFFVAVLDLTHALTYKGMAIFPAEGANLPTQLWIGARYLESLSLLVAPLLLRRRLKPGWILFAYGLLTLALLLSVFAWRIFPDCFVEGVGLTPFKRISEYIICLILAAGMVLLLKHREAFDRQILRWLVWSLGFTIASELAFTLYVSVYGVANLLGHYFKIVAFFCIYRAIIRTGLTQPYALLLREIKQREDQLARAKERLEVAQQAGRIGTFEWNVGSKETIMTEGMEAIYGEPPGGLTGKCAAWQQRVHPEDLARVEQAVAQALAGKAEYHTEYRILWPDGSIHWVGARGKVQRDQAGQPMHMIGVNMDITERKEFQAELERLVRERTAKLQELVAELQHVSYAIVHDMRAPLRALQGFTCLLDSCSEVERRAYCQRIVAAAKRMDLQITDALSYTQAVLQEVPLKPVALLPLLREVLIAYPNLHPDKADIHIQADLPQVWGNEGLLTQCCSNLLGNAVKFARSGTKPQIRVWAERRPLALDNPPTSSPGLIDHQKENAISEQAAVRLWVADNGVGIPKSAQARIFGMFQRMHHGYEGTGIGLAIVRKAVERMGGQVGVESEEGKGSRFWVDLKPAPEASDPNG